MVFTKCKLNIGMKLLKYNLRYNTRDLIKSLTEITSDRKHDNDYFTDNDDDEEGSDNDNNDDYDDEDGCDDDNSHAGDDDDSGAVVVMMIMMACQLIGNLSTFAKI